MIQFKRHRSLLILMYAKGIRTKISAFILCFSQNYQTYKFLTELQCRGVQQPYFFFFLGKKSQKMVTQLVRYVRVQDVSQSATPQVQPELLVLD